MFKKSNTSSRLNANVLNLKLKYCTVQLNCTFAAVAFLTTRGSLYHTLRIPAACASIVNISNCPEHVQRHSSTPDLSHQEAVYLAQNVFFERRRLVSSLIFCCFPADVFVRGRGVTLHVSACSAAPGPAFSLLHHATDLSGVGIFLSFGTRCGFVA